MKKKNNQIKDTPENSIKKSQKSLYQRTYKYLLIIPILLLTISIIIIAQTSLLQGVPIYRDVSLKGGTSAIVSINTKMSQNDLIYQLETTFPQNSVSISELFNKGTRTGFVIDTDILDDTLRENLNNIFKTQFVDGENYNSNVISPSLSAAFFSQAIKILIISFVLMSIVIFIYFRKLVPSFAVVLSGLFDVIVTIGILDLLKVKVSIAGIGALLMLIGYSIDTDVLLTNRLIKEPGNNYFEKTFDAFKTGLLMSLTTLFAGLVALTVTNSNVIYQISLILVIGLIVDIISTWLQNAGMLLLWLEEKGE